MRHLDSLDLPPCAGPTTGPAAPPRRTSLRGAGTRLTGAALFLAAGVLLAGCDGDNAFSGPESAGPTVTDLSVPSTIRVGDTLDVHLSASGATGVAGFSVSLRGVVNLDTLVEVSPAPTVTQTVRFALPAVFNRSTSLLVTAAAIDPTGDLGKLRSATISGLVVPPQVVALQAPDSIRPGTTLELSASAVGFAPIKGFVVQFRGAFRSDLSVPVAVPDTLASQSFQVQVPTVLEDTALTIDVQAVDETGAAGGVARWRLPVRVPPPEITAFSLRQDTVRAGGVLDLQVQARSLRRVQYFNVYLRGGVQTELVVPATPPRTSVDQDIPVPIPTGVRGNSVTVRIVAVDGAGALSAERADSARIALDVPVITSFVVSDSARLLGTLDARVAASGPRRIVRVDLSLRRGFEADVSASVSPLRTDITQDIAVPLTGEIYRGGPTVLVFTKVVDESGAVSAIDSTWVPVVAPDSTPADSTAADSTAGGNAAVVQALLEPAPPAAAGLPARVAAHPARIAASPPDRPRGAGGEGRQIPWPRVYTSEE